MRKKPIISVFVIFTLIVFTTALITKPKKSNVVVVTPKNTQPRAVPSIIRLPTQVHNPITTPPVGPRFDIGDISVKNFFLTGKNVDKLGNVILSQNSNYQIYYFKNTASFLISILATPFEKILPSAEKDLTDKLDISQQASCKLRVDITTPKFVDPAKAGNYFKLDYCK